MLQAKINCLPGFHCRPERHPKVTLRKQETVDCIHTLPFRVICQSPLRMINQNSQLTVTFLRSTLTKWHVSDYVLYKELPSFMICYFGLTIVMICFRMHWDVLLVPQILECALKATIIKWCMRREKMEGYCFVFVFC